jgi:nicotinate-nucleotide pyrophosphorylase (carboxylating)
MHPDRNDYLFLIDMGLKEDVGRGDITSMLFVQPDTQSRYVIRARETLVVCGVQVAEDCFRYRDPSLRLTIHAKDGQTLQAGGMIMEIAGDAHAMLAAERIALNFLQYLSGIATLTAQCVAEVAHTGVQILDTRKTLPAYRALSKYAVRCGGGRNHRVRLDDGVLVKDNHIALAGSLTKAILYARTHTPTLTKIEVECDSLAQVEEALAAGADVIMLDNMDIHTVTHAVQMVAGRVPLEVSGGITLTNLRTYAETGIQFISLGSLTHSVKAVDIGMDAIS